MAAWVFFITKQSTRRACPIMAFVWLDKTTDKNFLNNLQQSMLRIVK
jgi:hypothetical protein